MSCKIAPFSDANIIISSISSVFGPFSTTKLILTGFNPTYCVASIPFSIDNRPPSFPGIILNLSLCKECSDMLIMSSPASLIDLALDSRKEPLVVSYTSPLICFLILEIISSRSLLISGSHPVNFILLTPLRDAILTTSSISSGEGCSTFSTVPSIWQKKHLKLHTAFSILRLSRELP